MPLTKIKSTVTDLSELTTALELNINTRLGTRCKKLKSNNSGQGTQRRSVFIMADDTIKITGEVGYGALGLGVRAQSVVTPMTVHFPAGTGGVKEIYVDHVTNYALMQNGDVYAWGYNAYGQCADGTTTDVNMPKKISSLSNVTKLAIGHTDGVGSKATHVLALTLTGSLFAWGYNLQGQVGNGTTTTPVTTPYQIAGTWSDIDASVYGSRAINSSGTAYSWGHNPNGQLGLGNTTSQSSPQAVTSLPTTVSKIFSSYGNNDADNDSAGYTLWLLSDGRIYAAGYNAFGQLGIGNTTTPITTPTQVVGITNAVDIFASKGGAYYGNSGCLLSDNTVRIWGYNSVGQLGTGNTTTQSSPYNPGLSNVTKFIFGGIKSYHSSAALLTDGTVKVCGYNANGQLGIGTQTNISTFESMRTSLLNITDIADYGFRTEHFYQLLTTDGNVYATGYTGSGQTGADVIAVSTITYLTVPQPVLF